MTFEGNIDALTGREVFGSDGRKLGKVGQVFVLEGTDQPTWVTVRTGLLGSHESFVPIEGLTERGDELTVPYERAFVQDAPRIDDASDLTIEREAELYRYYGVQPPVQQAGAMADAGRHEDADEHRDLGQHRDVGQQRDRVDEHHDVGRHDDHRDVDSTRASSGDLGAATGGPRIRRRIVTEMQTIQVPVQREEIIVEGDGIGPDETDRR